MQSQFLGGTIVVIIGGIIVASVLAFIIFLIVRYRVCNQGDVDKVSLALFLLSALLFFCSLILLILKHGCLIEPLSFFSLFTHLSSLVSGSGDGRYSVTE